MAPLLPLIDKCSFKDIGKFNLASRVTAAAALCLSLGILASPVQAQSGSIILGNPQTSSELTARGYQVTTKVTQTATQTSITYTVTPPANNPPGPGFAIGRINMENVIPNGSFSVPASYTATFTGDIQVTPFNVFPSVTFGPNSGSSPQQQAGDLIPAKGSLAFSLTSAPSSPCTMTVSINVGNPKGTRLPYLNDFTGGGQSNIGMFRPSDGSWYLYYNSNPIGALPFGQNGDTPTVGDYDGDGISDLSVWRGSANAWYVRFSTSSRTFLLPWGQPGDLPVPADYDGDGRTDLAVWRASEGAWYVRESGSGQTMVAAWGQTGDVAVPGDYDGDGKADFAIWRTSEGKFYIRYSSTGEGIVELWGQPGDIPVPGDYDGDGITDIAIWRPSDGSWWIRNSSTLQTTMVYWGAQGDVPVVGDYDGDGRNDYAVWRPSNTTWYIHGSSQSQSPVNFGLRGDITVGQPVGLP